MRETLTERQVMTTRAPSKPPGCGSRRCRRTTWMFGAVTRSFLRPVDRRRGPYSGLLLRALGAHAIDNRAEEQRDHRNRHEVGCHSQSTSPGRDRIPKR
jgi:hypothetical protein